ncbi:hypothetical protein ACS8C1_20775, partial [Escherichia albertii]
MTIHKKGQAHWEGDIKHGKGTVKWHTEFGHLNRGDMLTSEQHR